MGRYIHRLCPPRSASPKYGPKVLAGLSEAPEIFPIVVITPATVKPIIRPANPDGALLSTATPIMANIKRNVPTISAKMAWRYPIPGNGAVAPSPPIVTAPIPTIIAKRKLATEAPCVVVGVNRINIKVNHRLTARLPLSSDLQHPSKL